MKSDLGKKLVIFGNSTPANKYADIVANIVCDNKMINRKFKDRNTTYFVGPKYIVLRREFYTFQSMGKNNPDEIRNILLTFGGSDPSNLTCSAVEHLLSSRSNYAITIILGAHFEYSAELNQVLAQHENIRNGIKIYHNIDNVAEEMYRADLVITSPGGSFFEALCTGTYTIAVNQSPLQKKWFENSFPSLDKSEIGKITNIISNRDFIDPGNAKIKQLEIGGGKDELVEAILGLK